MEPIYQLLLNNALFMQYLPGGLYSSDDVPYMSRQYVPSAFDSNTNVIKNCGFFQSNAAVGISVPLPNVSEDNFSVFLHSANSARDMNDPKRILYETLHYQKVPVDYGYVWYAEFVMEQPAWYDDHIEAWSNICRYRVIRNRR